MCIYIYIYIHTYVYTSLSLYIYIYIYKYICMPGVEGVHVEVAEEPPAPEAQHEALGASLLLLLLL